MHDNVIQFAATSKAPSTPHHAPLPAASEMPVPIAEFRQAKTAKAADVRAQQAARRKAWSKQKAIVDFRDASRNWHFALIIAQRYKIPETKGYPDVEVGDAQWFALTELHREALGRLLLTPAPDKATVNWKQNARNRSFSNVPEDQLDRSIAEDLAWLKKYPAAQRRVRHRDA